MSTTSSMSSVLSRIVNGLSTCQTRIQVWLKHLAFRIIHCGQKRVQDYYGWQKKTNKGSKTSKDSWVWEEGSSSRWSTTSTRGSSKRGQSVPVDPSKRTNLEEKGLPWRDLGEINVEQRLPLS